MAGKQITIELKGMHADDEHVLLDEFASELKAISGALKKIEKVVTKKNKPMVSYRVVNLSHSSPAKVLLEAQPIDPEEDYSDEVVERFYSAIDNISTRGEAPNDLDYHSLEAFKEIGTKVKKTLSRLVVSTNGHSCNITEDFQSKVKVIQGIDEEVKGSISGRVEYINFHGSSHVFNIYPSVGPTKIKCTFPKRLRSTAIESVNKYVTVLGKIKYKARTQFPLEIDVDQIEIRKPGKEFTKLADLKGIAPDLTEGLSPAGFVRKMRNEEWE